MNSLFLNWLMYIVKGTGTDTNKDLFASLSIWEKGYPKRFSIHELTAWKRDVQKYDQYVRNILAIKEKNDIPDELWSELRESGVDVKPYLIAIHDEITDLENIRHNTVEEAVQFYIKGYMKLHKIKEYNAAENIIDNIVRYEFDACKIVQPIANQAYKYKNA